MKLTSMFQKINDKEMLYRKRAKLKQDSEEQDL